MEQGLLLCGVIIFVCILANKVSSKVWVPTLLLFILLGMFAGSDGVLKIQFSDYHFAEIISSIALIFIMFYGGFGTNWRVAKPVVFPAVCLSTLGTVITAAVTGFFCHFVLHMEIMESFLIGAVISSTDAASVFSILRYKKLNLKHGLASMLEIESGSNDPTAYMLTAVLLSAMGGEPASFWQIIFVQIGLGLVFGVLLAYLSIFVLKRTRFENGGLESIFVVSIALISFALPQVLGGNGYLSVYMTGIMLGNSRIHHKTQLVHFFDGITWMMQIMLFFVIGLLSFPSQIPQVLGPAIAIALCLTFLSRPVAVFAVLSPFKVPFRQQLLVAWSGLRGAASIVFAIMTMVSRVYTGNDIFHIVFCVALFSVGLCGTLLPFVAKKLDLVDDKEQVFKTFTDYEHLSQLPLIDIVIGPGHPWMGKRLRELSLPSDLLVIMIKRQKQSVLPKGGTKILPGDVLIVSGAAYREDAENVLDEELIYPGHPWIDKSISEACGTIRVLLIKRDNATIVPDGDALIRQDDVIVYAER